MRNLTLDPTRLSAATVPLGTTWLLGSCMEERGKQDLWIRKKPEVLAALREQAVIQSVESSNRMEGVTVDPNRLKPVVLGGRGLATGRRKNWPATGARSTGFFV